MEYRDRFCNALTKKLGYSVSDFVEECIKDVENHLEKPLTPAEGKFDDLLAESIAIFARITIGTAQKAVKYAKGKARVSEVVVDDTTDIFSLYKKVAQMTGYSETEIQTMKFDCWYIDVAANIQDRIFSAMRNEGFSDFQLNAVWIDCGPKVDRNLEDDHVHIREGFFILEGTGR